MCDCECNNCVSSFSGLSGLLGQPTIGSYVLAGSVIEWGGYLRAGATGVSWGLDDGDLGGAIEGCLYATGAFDRVTVSQLGGSINIYIGISVTCAVDFAKLEDAFNLIVGELYNCAGMTADTQAFRVASVPAQAVNDPGIAQAGAGGDVNTQGASNSGWQWPLFSLPSASGGSKNPLDSLASFFGVGQTTAAIIGAGLAVGAVVLLKRAL